MRSIGARLTFWYALSATVTMAILFLAGYELLESRLIHGLDQLNDAEFRQLQVRLGDDYKNLDSRVMDERIRNTSESGSVLAPQPIMAMARMQAPATPVETGELVVSVDVHGEFELTH